MEEPSPVDRIDPEDKLCEEYFSTTHSRTANGRYVVRLPFKQNIGNIGNNRDAALRRFHSLEQKLQKNHTFSAEYSKFMREYEILGHMSQSNAESAYLIPHRGIWQGTTFIWLDLKKLSLPKEPIGMVEWIRSLGVGVRPADDPFFEEGDKICGVYTREGVVDVDEEDLCHILMKTFQCEVLNCKMEFDNLLNYELHYNAQHRYACSECKKHLPSPHLLDLHISESHDSFFMAQAERKPMYRCFVEDCSVISNNAKERRSHCIEIHKYPHDFKFDHSKRKSDPKKKKPAKEQNPSKTKSQEVESEMECDTAKNAKQVHLGAFSFGHKKIGRTFKTSKEKKEKPIEMHELMESLPS